MTEETVMAALGAVREPDIGADVVSLGLVRSLEITPERVLVRMNMTSSRAQVGVIIDAVERVLWRPGGPAVDVEIVREPRWEPSRVSPEALRALGRPVFRSA